MANDDTTKLSDFLGTQSVPPVQGKPGPLPEALEDKPSAGTQSMGTFLDSVGADLSVPPDSEDGVDDLFDPHATLDTGTERDPEDHRSFLASMGVPVTPAPVQRRAGNRVVDTARRAGQTVQKNWVPSLLMAIAISVILFWLVGLFRF